MVIGVRLRKLKLNDIVKDVTKNKLKITKKRIDSRGRMPSGFFVKKKY